MPVQSVQNDQHLDALRISRPPEKTRHARNPRASIISLILFVVVAGLISYLVYSRIGNRQPVVETMMVTASASRQPGVMLTGSGYIVTRHKYITIGTKILGQIVAEPIEEGQHVKAGELLAQIDDRDYQAQLRQAVAARDLAEANVRLSVAKAERAKKLDGTGAISKDDYDTAINAMEVAQAQLKRDEAAVDYAKFEVGQCVITSPINGIVLKKYRELGDTINYGGQIQAGGGATDIAQLADTDDMRAEVDINESDIAKVDLGSVATVISDAYNDRHFDATLVKVYPEADRQKGTVKVEVQIQKPDLHVIKPEMSVKVSFLEARTNASVDSTISVPKSAVITEGSKSFVWVVKDSALHRTPITRGHETETSIEIKEGLKDGDMIAMSSGEKFQDGQRVAVGHGR